MTTMKLGDEAFGGLEFDTHCVLFHHQESGKIGIQAVYTSETGNEGLY
jgi:hypothetical protein